MDASSSSSKSQSSTASTGFKNPKSSSSSSSSFNRVISKTLTDMIASITPITPYLSVSGCLPVCTRTLLDEHYTAALCCMDGFKYEFPRDRIEYLHIPIADARETDLRPHLGKACDLIDRHRRRCQNNNNNTGKSAGISGSESGISGSASGGGGRTLVFCAQGISRSVSFVLAYLVKYERMTLLEAFHLVRQRRRLACPNVGFFKQLIELERETHNGRQTVTIIEPYDGFEVADIVWKYSGEILDELSRE